MSMDRRDDGAIGTRGARGLARAGRACLGACVLGAAGTWPAVSGCASAPTSLAGGPVGAYDRPYPLELAQSEVIDVQVVRAPETVITLTNSTPRAFGASTLWINRRFSRPVNEFLSGQTLRLSLTEFRDEYGERFRAGGFFATKKPEPVVQAQLETLVNGESRMIGLIVIGEEE